MKFFLDDSEFDAQLQRTASAVNAESADLGEALATAKRVVSGDFNDWFTQWSALAERTALTAEKAASSGQSVTA
jgi:hypothetical protein